MTACRRPVVAIDGPAGAGKSTAARGLARRLGLRYLDTGAMYRALALSVLEAGLEDAESPALRAHLAGLDLDVQESGVWLNGRDVTVAIRAPAVSAFTSRLTRLRVVRDRVLPLQRQASAAGGIVLEGRDTGTVVCPEADVKIFLTAALEVRARRRHAELGGCGDAVVLARLTADLAARDRQDAERELAPLVKASDAIEVDTTELAAEEVVERLARVVEARCSTAS